MIQRQLQPKEASLTLLARAVYRYRSPAMQQKMFELEQCRERLTIEADLAFLEFLK